MGVRGAVLLSPFPYGRLSPVPDDQGRRDRHQTFAAPREAEAVRGRPRHRHRGSRRLRQGFLRLVPALADLGPGTHHLYGDVADAEARRTHDAGRLRQEGDARCTRPLGAAGAEVLTEVTEAGCGEERVA